MTTILISDQESSAQKAHHRHRFSSLRASDRSAFALGVAALSVAALFISGCTNSASDGADSWSSGTVAATQPGTDVTIEGGSAAGGSTTTTAVSSSSVASDETTTTTEVDGETDPEPTGTPIDTYATIVAAGPAEPVSFSYEVLASQAWTLEVDSVWSQQTVFVADGQDAKALVAVEITLTYEGESKSGQVLDLVFDLETADGTTSAVHSPCRPAPAGSMDMFRSVKLDEPLTAMVCFATDSEPIALLVTPMIEDQLRIPFS